MELVDKAADSGAEAGIGAGAGGRRLAVGGGVLGALGMTSCCILPLVLFSVGVTGSWIGRLSSLYQYRPYFLTFAVISLGLGYWAVYRRSRTACATGGGCANPLSDRVMKAALWASTAIVAFSLAFSYFGQYVLFGF